nr:iron ABC transporter permease [Schwartzia sp. (in: firmicutes)]
MSLKKPSIWMAFTLVILCFFVLFVVYPLFLIMYQSVVDPVNHQLTLDYFTKFFGRKFYWSTLVNSFSVTICSTLLAALIGLPMAYLLRSYKIPASKYVNILIVISYLSPPFIGAYAWIQLLGR